MPRSFNSIIQTVEFPRGTAHRTLPLQNEHCRPLREAGLMIAGLSDTPVGYVVERRAPPMHEVLFTLAGQGKLQVGKNETPLTPGCVMLLPAGSRYRYTSDGGEWRIMWFHGFGTSLWTELVHGCCQVREAFVMDELHRAMEGLLAETLRTDMLSGPLLNTFSQLIALLLQRELQTAKTPHEQKVREHLHALWSRVETRLDDEWTVERMAGELYMSEPHFFRACLQHMGCSPMRMLFRLRMQRAEELLTQHDYPLKTIAAMVGYGTPFAFSNAFKRYRGISPSEFREDSTLANTPGAEED